MGDDMDSKVICIPKCPAIFFFLKVGLFCNKLTDFYCFQYHFVVEIFFQTICTFTSNNALWNVLRSTFVLGEKLTSSNLVKF